MILEYKKTIKDAMQTLEIYNDFNRQYVDVSKPLIKKLAWAILKFKKVGKEVTKTTVLEDSLKIENQGEKHILKFIDIDKIDQREGFIALISDGEIEFTIHEKHFKNIEEKNQFLKIIEDKVAKNKGIIRGSKGLLRNEVNYEDLTDEEKEENFMSYEVGNKSYRAFISLGLTDKKKYRTFIGVWITSILMLIIILLVDKMQLIRESLIFILLLGPLILTITMFVMKKRFFKDKDRIIKKIKKDLNGKNAEIKILKTKDGIIYDLNGVEEFISIERVEKIEDQKNVVLIKIKDMEIPILLIKYDGKARKTQRLIKAVKSSISNIKG